MRQAEKDGELKRAEGYGKPLAEDDAWFGTPEALRMPFKILKDAGVTPPEIALFHERAALAAALKSASDDAECRAIQQKLSELEQKISLRLEALQRNAGL